MVRNFSAPNFASAGFPDSKAVVNEDDQILALFVYGTLKRGSSAHESLFGGSVEAIDATPSVVRGSLFDLPAGFPALSVPETNVIATGTANPEADARTQRNASLADGVSQGSGARVHGEILRASGRLLPALDAFEGFRPGGESLYERVLIPAWTESGENLAVWAYVMENPSGSRIPGGKWEPREGEVHFSR